MMKNKKLIPLCWLLLIPCQCVAGMLFFRMGMRLDLMLFSNPVGGGHGIPFFSVIFFLMAAITTVVVFILSVVMTVRGYRK